MKRNPNFEKVSSLYLFPEIQLRKKKFLEKNPQAHLLNLSIGDTSLPLLPAISEALSKKSEGLGTANGYQGYGPEQGDLKLREKISEKLYAKKILPDNIFISDGAKCDIGRLQLLFGSDISIVLFDPAYPVYQDGSLLQGVREIIRLPTLPSNNFFPELKKGDLLYFCSPNNPTGKAATKEELKKLVDFAKKNRSIILFDSAYSCYIQDPKLPKSIYEVEGANEVAIEIGSFSKMAGFSGVRLGWTIIPHELCYDNGKKVQDDWNRLVTTVFNGASILSQAGGIAALDHFAEIKKQISFYLENAALLKETLSKKYPVYGGENAPYLWVDFGKQTAWDAFQTLLEQCHIVTTPGIGFGPSGEHFLRFSAFGSRETLLEAKQRLSQFFLY